MNRQGSSRTAAQLDILDLHGSLSSPVSESMNFLNEVAQSFPDAISFAAGRPYEGFFDLDAIPRYLETYRRHLLSERSGDEAAVRRTILQYGRTKGIICEVIAEHLRVDEGIVAEPDSIVVTVGCQEALYLTLRALRRSDKDVVLAIAPSYVGVHGAAQLVDMPLLTVKDSAWGIDLDDLATVVRRARASGLNPRACYVIPDFANPSGTSMSLDTRRRLLRFAHEQDLLILEDNAYGLLRDGPGPPTLKSMDDAERVVYLGSFAKTGVPGARVGYAVAGQRVVGTPGGPTTLADQLAKIKSMLTVNTSPIAQAVIGGKLLENGYSLRAANALETRTYRDNLRGLLDGLSRRFADLGAGVSWNAPAGGFFLLLSVPFAAGDELLRVSARRHRVLWTPMHHFYADAKPRNQIRLSFSHLEPHEIEEGLDRLAAFVEEQSRI